MTAQEMELIRQLISKVNRLEKRLGITETIEGGSSGGAVDSVNGQTGTVVLDTDDIAEGATNLWFTAAEETKLAGIEAGADVTDATNVAAAGAVMDSELIATSAGAGDAGKPIKLDAAGHVDATMINDGDIDHGSIGGLGDDDHTQYHNDARGDVRYAPIAKGVTNGDSHDHNGGDGGTIAYSSLSGTPTVYTQEQIEDFVGGMVSSNTETGIAVTYDDTNGKLNFDAQTAGDARYALIANGVTNGNSHDHNGGDGATIPNAGLANSSVTIGSTSVSLGATAATVAGLTLTTPTVASFTNATHNHTNAAGGGQLDHGAALTGLGDDDHTQYHNDTRGDARYVALTGAQTVAGIKDFTDGIKVANGTTLTHFSSGTWPIALRFGGATTGITYGTQTGTYLRINNRVWLHGTIILTNKGSATGAADISGLPFTVATTTVAATRWRAMNTSYIYLTVVPLTGTTTMTFRATTAAAAGVETTLADTNFTNTSTITFEATYEV